MAAGSFIQTSKNQQGVVLLVLLIAIVLASASYLLSGLSLNQVKIEQKTQTRIVLKKAKQALIAHAVTRADRAGKEGEIGYLPCPDWNTGFDEGESDGNCGSAQTNTVGYFPWVSLDTPIFWDNSGSCLWYAVSGSYKNPNSSLRMINEDSNGLFQIMDETNTVIIGNNPEDRIVAIIFAPGEQLTGQARVLDADSFCGKNYGNVTAYLEGNGTIDNGAFDGNADVVDKFIHASNASATEATPYNDRFITITRDEIWEAMLNRSDFAEKMENLTQALAMCLVSYANLPDNSSRRLPWPVVTNFGVNDYRNNASYQDSAPTINHGYSGRLPFNVANSNAAIDVALIVDEIFDMANCSALAVLTGSTAATANLLDPSAPGPPPVAATEYRKLWDNWKDHFFYILSKPYEPDNTGEQTCSGSDCIKVNGAEYAGAVIFSGKRLLDAGGNDTLRSDKSVVTDYLEDGKATVFATEITNKTGSEDYNYTDPQTDTINDIMYCINDHPIVDDPLTLLVDETEITVAECL